MLFALADLHLGFSMNKPMGKFGDNWENHHVKIEENWSSVVGEGDTVIIPGDVSWAMDMKNFMPDFTFIERLPGKKIIIGGNHDFWWSSTSKLNALNKDIFFMKNDFARYQDLHICGTRGWLCAGDSEYKKHDEKIYKREAARLKTSLDGAMKDGAKEILAVFHYPPMNDRYEESLFMQTLAEYPVKDIVYGHLHGRRAFAKRIENNKKEPSGFCYRLVSCDFLDFMPLLLRS